MARPSQTAPGPESRLWFRRTWGPECGDETHYLRVHVAHIRAKLEPDLSWAVALNGGHLEGGSRATCRGESRPVSG